MEPVRLAGADARPGCIGESPRWCSFPPERVLERSVKMNPGEIILARMWSTGRWRRERNWNPTFSADAIGRNDFHVWQDPTSRFCLDVRSAGPQNPRIADGRCRVACSG